MDSLLIIYSVLTTTLLLAGGLYGLYLKNLYDLYNITIKFNKNLETYNEETQEVANALLNVRVITNEMARTLNINPDMKEYTSISFEGKKND